jgi:NAD(P)-dependent dehydrogenase (short-subunit alcohol dehydrogenase family)
VRSLCRTSSLVCEGVVRLATACCLAGTRGIGLAIARCLARDGFNLVLGYNSNSERAKKEASAIEEDQPGVYVHLTEGDIADPGTVGELFRGVEVRFQALQALQSRSVKESWTPAMHVDV